jgi:glycosyltransferase involved in cell wall biosynthesis
MRVLIATDAFAPQVNGVVRSLEAIAAWGPRHGLDVTFLSPDDFASLPMPGYREIRLSLATRRRALAALDHVRPRAVHIATEGPVGIAMRRACIARRLPFTTSYHTRFPEYLRARLPVPTTLTYAWLRRFHNASRGIMIATAGLEAELRGRGFAPLMRWPRGVDIDRFRPREASALDLPRPIFLTVGRVAVEKNLDAFLGLDLPGSKVVVGDGPALDDYRARYPAAHFMGARTGDALAAIYGSADAFVFPSRTDTFGLVLLEALACGLPGAAFPVAGPCDVITSPRVGVLDDDLRAAALGALTRSREACVAFARPHTWEASVAQFARNLASVPAIAA